MKKALVFYNLIVKRNYISITGSAAPAHTNQVYDLNVLIGKDIEHLTGSRIEVKRVFHQRPPAIARIYDPFSMTGMSYSNVLSEMGFSAYSPATQFLMTPIFEDLERVQAIEFNDMVRKSSYSFEIVNNKLKLFPIPTGNYKVYFEYALESDRDANAYYTGSSNTPSGSIPDQISDFSNVPYEDVVYHKINSPGRQWIRKYYLALCKEMLGAIRQKYSTIPIPGGEVTLDGAELRSEASNEKDALMTQLRDMLEASLPSKLIEEQAMKADKSTEILRKVPLMIYIG